MSDVMESGIPTIAAMLEGFRRGLYEAVHLGGVHKVRADRIMADVERLIEAAKAHGAAVEREECAVLIDQYIDQDNDWNDEVACRGTREACSAGIRKRGRP